MARFLPGDAPIKQLPSDAARAVLDLMQLDEDLRFVYGAVSVSDSGLERVDAKKTWLVGIGDRLALFTIEDRPRPIWQGDKRVRLERVKGYLSDSCRLTGGDWLVDSADSAPNLVVKGSVMGKYDRFFGPLIEFCGE